MRVVHTEQRITTTTLFTQQLVAGKSCFFPDFISQSTV